MGRKRSPTVVQYEVYLICLGLSCEPRDRGSVPVAQIAEYGHARAPLLAFLQGAEGEYIAPYISIAHAVP